MHNMRLQNKLFVCVFRPPEFIVRLKADVIKKKVRIKIDINQLFMYHCEDAWGGHEYMFLTVIFIFLKGFCCYFARLMVI